MPQIDMLREHLAQAESHIAIGEEHLRKQRRIIAELEEHGHNTKMARELLKEFEDVQTMHVADKERVLKEIERELRRDATSA